MGKLLVGTSKRNITPPVGAWLAGYGSRDHGAEGVRDELYTRVTVLSDGETEAAIICRDLLDVEDNEMAMLASRLQERTGLAHEQLFVANTHTHSGPTTHYSEEAKNRDYVENLADVVVGAVVEARAHMRPATLAWAQRPVQCGVNRRERTPDGRTILGVNPAGPCDTVADILCFADAETGEPLSTLFRHAVHGVVMGGENYLISGDMPGAAERFVERNLPGQAAFLSGCCGDINAHPRGSFAAVELLGRRLGGAVCQGTTELDTPRAEVTIACLRHELLLPVEPLPPAQESEAVVADLEPRVEALQQGKGDPKGELGLWHAERLLRQARERLEAARSGEPITGKPIVLPVLVLGDIVLIGYPCEVFFDIGRQVQAQSPFPHTLTVTHVDGWNGYVPTADAYPDGGYEVDTARAHYRGLGITPEAEQVLVAESLRALQRAYVVIA